MDPQWISKIYNKTSGEDFLGLRLVQQNIVGYLLPGIITITPRARYYSFYSWLFVEYANQHPASWSIGDFIKRREQIFVLANIIYDPEDEFEDGVFGLTGSRMLSRYMKDNPDLTNYLLNNDDYVEAPNGGYDAYAGVMQSLGITHIAKNSSDGKEYTKISSMGEELANVFAKSIESTFYFKNRLDYDKAFCISRSVLKEYGEKCHLGTLSSSPDNMPILDLLFAFNSGKPLLNPSETGNSLPNMRISLGLILDMASQSTKRLTDMDFRQNVLYGYCKNYNKYQPKREFLPILSHWQVWELRELYVYALYLLWSSFLKWLKIHSPANLEQFFNQLNGEVNISGVLHELGIDIPSTRINEYLVSDLIKDILLPNNGSIFDLRWDSFSANSENKLHEYLIIDKIQSSTDQNVYVQISYGWLLLLCVYFRLKGISKDNYPPAWHWANFGGDRRRSLDLFVKKLSKALTDESTIGDVLGWIFRDYTISQHTITSLEKWQQRNVNTFHFNYENGVFDWVEDDSTGFSASRFVQAYSMLRDLGLITADNGEYGLSQLGKDTLNRVLESIRE